MKRHALATAIFIFGCATGGVASQLVVPPARAGTTPTRWEHACMNMTSGTGTALNKYGAEGWELVSAFTARFDYTEMEKDLVAESYAFCFKRALPGT